MSHKNRIRKDVLASSNPNSSKGTRRDPMRQQVAFDNNISPEQISLFYQNNNGIFSNIIDVPAEDATKFLPKFVFKDKKYENLNDQIQKKLIALDFQNKLQLMVKYERLYGNGYMLPILLEKGGSLSKELKGENIVDILQFNVFSVQNTKFGSVELDKDLLSVNYLKPKKYIIDKQDVHHSRIFDLKTTQIEDSPYGVPILKKIYDTMIILDSTAWSVGQIVYSFVFKVLKSDEASFSQNAEREKFERELENEFNTRTIAVIGKEDELAFISPTNAMNNLKDIFTFIWDLISGAAKMPKSHILGQPQGTVTGGQYDTINYYAKIKEYQENFLKPIYRKVVDLLLLGSFTGVGTGSLVLDYDIEFKTLWELDQKEQASVNKMNAETDEIRIRTGVLSPDEIRNKINGQPPLPDEYKSKLAIFNGNKANSSGANIDKGGGTNGETSSEKK